MGESFIITFAMQIIVGAVAQAVVKGQFQAAAYKSGLFKEFGMGFTPVLFFIIVGGDHATNSGKNPVRPQSLFPGGEHVRRENGGRAHKAGAHHQPRIVRHCARAWRVCWWSAA